MVHLSTVRGLRLRYIIGLSAIALLITASFFTMKQVVSRQRGYSSLVNLAGHQAGLASRIAYFVSLMAITDDQLEFNTARAQVGRTINKMKAAHRILRNGDPQQNIPYVTNPNLETIYEDPMVGLDLAITRFIERSQTAYASDMHTLDTGSAAYLYVTTYGPHVLEPMLDAAVDEYEAIGRKAIVRIERLEQIIWVTTLVTLLLEVIFIFHPLEFNVRRTIRSLETSITALRNTRKRLQAAQKLAGIGDWEIDMADGALTWSDQIYHICGVAPQSFTLTRDAAAACIHPADRASVASGLKWLIKHPTRSLDTEFRIVRPDGTERRVYQHAVASTGENRRIDRLTGTVQDITERKELAIRLEKLTEQIPGFMFQYRLDAQGHSRMPYASKGIRDTFGISPEQAGTNAHRFFELIHEEDVAQVKDSIAQSRDQLTTWHDRYRIHHPEKGDIWLEGHATPERLSNGDTLWYGYIWEITARKRAEVERRRLEERLNQSHKMEAIGTLAGGIAHDFNNLMMGIQGRASLMAVELDARHPHREHLEAIESYIRSAVDLTKQLLGFARSGKYDVKPVSINTLVHDSITMFGRTRKEIDVNTKLDPSAPVVEADQRQLEQVLLNLYVNAWQAMPDGGGLHLQTGTVEFDDSFCEPNGIRPGRYARISVTDAGIGMNAATRKRVFDPFFTTKEKGRGTGLGLASAYGIVKNHGGLITVYSEIGQGATFNIYLPLSTKAVQPDAPADETIVPGSGGILLVDDEQMIVEVGRAMLEKLGYRAAIAGSGEEALSILTAKAAEIDLVILDLVMPGMDGGETFNRIRTMRPALPVILSSGYAINGKADAIMQRGCNGFIQKPFSLAELSRKIRQVFDPLQSPDSTPRS